MPDLVLDPKQSNIVLKAAGRIRILDDRGREIGTLTPLRPEDEAPLSITPDEILELKRRMADPNVNLHNLPTTKEVLERLKQRGRA